MTRWRRVAPNWTRFTMSAVFVAIGFLVLLALLLLGSAVRPGAWIASAFVTVFVTLWTLAALRLNRMGLFTSAEGIRLRTFLRTRTLPWREIAMFEDRQATMGIWPFEQLFASLYGPRAIWIVLEDGTHVQTHLTYMKPPEIEDDGGGILHQVMSGAMGARFLRSLSNAGEDLHMIESPQRCRAALMELRQALVASRS